MDAFIYQRATSKSGRWYFRIYDEKRKKPVIKSLKTSDKVQALANARLQYVDIKGKIERGERLKLLSQSRQSVSNAATKRKTTKQK